MAKKAQTNTIAAWLWRAPIKFTGLLVIGMTLLILAMSLITIPFENPMPEWTGWIFALVLLSFIGFSIYKLIKFTPTDYLDRKSFVGIDIGITFIGIMLYFILPLITILALGFDSFEQFMVVMGYYMGYMAALKPITFFIIAFILSIVLSIVATYVSGLMLSNYIIMFRRGQMMGISKLKLWLSFPFGLHLLWLPEYFLPEEKKTKPATQLKSKWFSNFVDWVVKKPMNAIIVWLIMIGFGAAATFLASGELTPNTLLELFLIVLFVVILAILGVKRFRTAVPGWFSWMAAIVNILVIIAIFCYAISINNAVRLHPGDAPQIESVDFDEPVQIELDEDYSAGGLYQNEEIEVIEVE